MLNDACRPDQRGQPGCLTALVTQECTSDAHSRTFHLFSFNNHSNSPGKGSVPRPASGKDLSRWSRFGIIAVGARLMIARNI